MTDVVIPAELRALVRNRANRLCEYCQSSERASGHYFEVDHIIPQSKGGQTIADNLALACRSCNGNKRDHSHGRDPDTGELVTLFNPRIQSWNEHFSWGDTVIEILPLSGVGRVTMDVLKMNDPLVVGARAIWVIAKVHPPPR